MGEHEICIMLNVASNTDFKGSAVRIKGNKPTGKKSVQSLKVRLSRN